MSTIITDANFSELIEKSGKPVLIDLWAPWCGPCRVLSPIIDELSTEYSANDVIIGKINVDESPELSAKFGIRSIPTLLFIKDNGEVSEKMVGLKPKSEIVAKLNSLIKKDE